MYLTNIPTEDIKEYGLLKTLLVRREVIHIKHIMTEIFVRKTIQLDKFFEHTGLDLFSYMEFLTNRIRKIHHIDRGYSFEADEIVKREDDRFFPLIEIYNQLNPLIILDFDGVVTENNFKPFYDRLVFQLHKVCICTANPTVNKDWFEKREYKVPHIHARKGKTAKIKALLEFGKNSDICFYIDNEDEYLEYAWLMGIRTFKWTNNKIVYYTRKTK